VGGEGLELVVGRVRFKKVAMGKIGID